MGVTRPQIPGTYWTSILGGWRSEAAFLSTDFLAYSLQKFPLVFLNFYFTFYLASKRSEGNTIRGVQIRAGAVYICMEVRMPY